MELFNKGLRIIDGLKPNESASFEEEVANKLLRLYKDELVVAGSQSVISTDKELNDYVAQLEAEIAELKAGDKAKIKKELAELQAIVDANADKDATIEALKAEIAELSKDAE